MLALVLAPTELEACLRRNFPDARLEIRDLTGTQDHYEVHLGSKRFAGLSLLQSHRLVYAALGDHMRQNIHALALKTSPVGLEPNAGEPESP